MLAARHAALPPTHHGVLEATWKYERQLAKMNSMLSTSELQAREVRGADGAGERSVEGGATPMTMLLSYDLHVILNFCHSVFQLQRNILASNPRVTRFHINWEGLGDKMEDCENVDPSPNVSGMLPPSCIPAKMPPLALMPDNSMDCM